MNKKEIYALLSTRNIWYEVTEHKAVYNMAEVAEIRLPYPEADAKNLFIRDDKKRNYYLITVKGDKRVDLKAFRQQNDTRPLTFASDQDLMDMLDLIPGAVTPLGPFFSTVISMDSLSQSTLPFTICAGGWKYAGRLHGLIK